MSEQSSKGLKARRAVRGHKPTHECSNCKCVRYSPCTCMKKAGAE